MIKLNELDEAGYWVGDLFLVDDGPGVDNWTADLAPDGLFKGRYTGGRTLSGEWTGGEWAEEGSPAPPTEESQRHIQSILRESADYRIAPLQDAVDLEEATAEEAALLTQWKRYRVALNRVDTQPGWPEVVEWPTPPTEDS